MRNQTFGFANKIFLFTKDKNYTTEMHNNMLYKICTSQIEAFKKFAFFISVVLVLVFLLNYLHSLGEA